MIGLLAQVSTASELQQCPRESTAQTQCSTNRALFNTKIMQLAQAASCPAGYPMDCGDGENCCPAGHTLYCPQMEPTPCFDPDTMTAEQLATLRANCNPLLSCR